jgi:hypothetical protein
MSIKVFHILFVIVSVLLSTGFGWWCLETGYSENASVNTFSGIASFALAGVLFIYGVKVWKKFQGEDFKSK